MGVAPLQALIMNWNIGKLWGLCDLFEHFLRNIGILITAHGSFIRFSQESPFIEFPFATQIKVKCNQNKILIAVAFNYGALIKKWNGSTLNGTLCFFFCGQTLWSVGWKINIDRTDTN